MTLPPPAALSGSPLFSGALGHAAAGTVVWSKLVDTGGDLAVNLAVAVAILLASIWLARWTQKLVRSALGRLHAKQGPSDPTFQIFVAALARNAVLLLGIIAVLQQLGVKTTSIIAAISAASLAVGLAMQGTLSNVAAGVMIFLFRPYRVGDIIETGGRTGRVISLDLFITELATLDNLKVVVPNSKLFGDVIVDHSAHPQRRADVTFHVPSAADPRAIMDQLRRRLDADRRVLKDPACVVELTQVTEAFMEIAVRPWVLREDYASMKADILLWGRLLASDPKTAPAELVAAQA
jgi:small conductance mechanosensitive channel